MRYLMVHQLAETALCKSFEGVCHDICRYIHERLAQCPEQEQLEGRARQLTAAAGRDWPIVGPLEVRR